MGDVKPPAGLARNPKILLWVHFVIQENFLERLVRALWSSLKPIYS